MPHSNHNSDMKTNNIMATLRTIGIGLLLLCVNVRAFADDKKGDEDKKAKKETKYDKLFKDKKKETASSKFITVHKSDGKLYLEVPVKYLHKEMLLGGGISSTTDPTYLTIGTKSFTPLHFFFEVQDSSLVMKTPNSVVYSDGSASAEMQEALKISYRDPVLMGFKIAAYNNDSSAIVIDATDLLARPNSMLPIIPKKSGDLALSASPKSEMSYVRTIKSFDRNITINVDFNYLLTASLMSLPVASEIPTTVGVTYSLALLPDSKMRQRVTDSRVGIASVSKLTFDNNIAKSKQTFIAQRWNLVPQNLKAYEQGKLSKPIKPICFYIDDAFPVEWKNAIKQGVELWNKAFEQAGYQKAIEALDFPKNDHNFDADDIAYSCIRYVPSTAEKVTSSFLANPQTGEIINASVFVPANVGDQIYRWLFLGSAASDATMRTSHLPQDKFNQGLKYMVACEVGRSLGLLDNIGASYSYPVDSLRNSTFTRANNLAASIMANTPFNYVAQPSDKGVVYMPESVGQYDKHAIEWAYRYFDPSKTSLSAETDALEKMVDKRVQNPRYRFFRTSSLIWDPRVQEGALGSDAIKASEYGLRNMQIVENNLYNWVKDDEDSRIKEKLYLAISQQRYAFFKRVLSNVGGIFLNDMKVTSGVPRYEVVPKARQRQAMLWCLNQAKHFKQYANPSFERKGFMAISYYDQLLEFIGYDLFGVRTRLAVASHLSSQSYSQKEYFDDLFSSLFQSAQLCKAPSQEERVLQRAYLTYSRAVIDKANKQGGNGPAALQSTSINGSQTSSTAYGNPTASLAPTVDAALLDGSAIYFYTSLLKLKPMLEKCVKANLSPDAHSHYSMLLFKVNKALEDGQ